MLLFSKPLSSRRTPTAIAKRRRLRLEPLENRQLLAADSLAIADPADVSSPEPVADVVASQETSGEQASLDSGLETENAESNGVESDGEASSRRFVGSGRGRVRQPVPALNVRFGSIGVNTEMAGVNVTMQGFRAGKIDAWIDFNGNSQWESGERILTDVDLIEGMQTLNFFVPEDASMGNTVARVFVTPAGPSTSSATVMPDEFQHFDVTVFPVVPEVESVTINEGHASRSKVTSLSVTFTNELDHAALESAFLVTNVSTDTTVSHVEVAASDEDGKTTAVLTFSGASTVTPVDESLGTTLMDGNYTLEILASSVALASDTSATMSTDYQFGGETIVDSENDDFFVWYGDHDGDGDTDFADFELGFRPAFGSVLGDAEYDEMLDADGDGIVNYRDFAEVFLQKLGSSRP